MYWEEIFCVHFFYQNPFQDVESNIQWLNIADCETALRSQGSLRVNKCQQDQQGHQGHPKVTLRLSQGYPKIILKSSQSHPKVIPRSSQGHPKVIPKSSQGHPKVIPRSARANKGKLGSQFQRVTQRTDRRTDQQGHL